MFTPSAETWLTSKNGWFWSTHVQYGGTGVASIWLDGFYFRCVIPSQGTFPFTKIVRCHNQVQQIEEARNKTMLPFFHLRGKKTNFPSCCGATPDWQFAGESHSCPAAPLRAPQTSLDWVWFPSPRSSLACLLFVLSSSTSSSSSSP